MQVLGRDVRIDGGVIRIARLAAEQYEFIDNPEPMLTALRHSPTRVDVFTFMQRLPFTEPRFAFQMELDNLAAVPITTFEEWWTKQINGKTRNMVRRAEKCGVTTRAVPFDDDLVRGISAIYNETPVRQGRPFWHYGKDLEWVRKDNATFMDRSVFIGAYHDDVLIGFAKLVTEEHGEQAGLMQILSMVQHRDKAPTNALIAHAVRSCAERGIRHLVYANFAYGNKQRDSLAEFKQHNGFLKIDLPRYYVPLSIAGNVALRFGLHRRFVDHIPEPLAARLRKLRSTWNARTLPLRKQRSVTV
jgi:hypothetical protein